MLVANAYEYFNIAEKSDTFYFYYGLKYFTQKRFIYKL